MKRKSRKAIALGIAFSVILFSAFFLSSCENNQNKKLPAIKQGIVPENAFNVQISELSDSRTTLIFFETTLTPSQIKAYYLTLASRKQWNLKNEHPLRDGFVLTFDGKGKAFEISVQKEEKAMQVTLMLRNL